MNDLETAKESLESLLVVIREQCSLLDTLGWETAHRGLEDVCEECSEKLGEVGEFLEKRVKVVQELSANPDCIL